MGQAVLSERVTPYKDDGVFQLRMTVSHLERKGIGLTFPTLARRSVLRDQAR